MNWLEEVEDSIASESLLAFMQRTWLKPNSPMIVGRHTKAITKAIDKAVENYGKGISSYLHIVVPFRHGKSEISSKNLPAYFLGKYPDAEVIQTSYGADLSEGFSKDVKSIMEGEIYKRIFKTRLKRGSSSNKMREIEDGAGRYHAVGADGGATGKGADLLIVDDFFKNRIEADSPTTRFKRWESFTQDFLSRIAPVHIVLVLNTRWHVDDLSGNILNRNNPNHKKYDPDFPVFQNMHFRAREQVKAKGEDGKPVYKYLFTERFDEVWYRRQFAIQGAYGSASLLQGEPTLRGGNMFHMEGVKSMAKEDVPEDLLWVRFWDLASTEKERVSDDPDYTSGGECAYWPIKVLDSDNKTVYIDRFIVRDVVTAQAEAPARNRMITTTAECDGEAVWQGIESVAGYKDSYTTLKGILSGRSIVHKITVSGKGDKLTRAGVLEPVFEAGNMHFVDGKWNDRVYTQFSEFPACIHDDDVDAVVGGCALAKERYEKSVELGANLGFGLVKDDDDDE